MATTEYEKRVAKEVILKFAELGVQSFNDKDYREIVDLILCKAGFRFLQGRSCERRRIRPLVFCGFSNKFSRAQKELKKRQSKLVEPPEIPEESKLGLSLDQVHREALRALDDEIQAREMAERLEQGHELSCPPV